MRKGLIIGDGIGGLTTAIALAKKGIGVTLFQETKDINENDDGILVTPNGMKVFEKLGLSNQIMQCGKALNKINIVDLNYKPLLIIDGNEIEKRHQFKTTALHRATLQKILKDNVPSDSIVINKKLKSYRQSENRIIAEFTDGTSVDGDFLIYAEDINLNRGFQLNYKPNLRYSGQTCWHFITDFTFPLKEDGNMYEIWAKSKGLRVGYTQINEKQVYVFITNYQKAGGKDNTETLKLDLLALCSGFPEMVEQMIFALTPNNVIRTDLYYHNSINNWIDKRFVLIGDSVHTTALNLGQCSCQAIEDAYMISEELSLRNDVETCLSNYQQKRIKKATFIRKESCKYIKLTNTSGFTKSIIKSLFRITPDALYNKQVDKIYSINF